MSYIKVNSSTPIVNNWSQECVQYGRDLDLLISIVDEIYNELTMELKKRYIKAFYVFSSVNIALIFMGILFLIFEEDMMRFITFINPLVNFIMIVYFYNSDLLKKWKIYCEAKTLTSSLLIKLQKETKKPFSQRTDAKMFLQKIYDEYKYIQCNFNIPFDLKQVYSNKYSINLDAPLKFKNTNTIYESSGEEDII